MQQHVFKQQITTQQRNFQHRNLALLHKFLTENPGTAVLIIKEKIKMLQHRIYQISSLKSFQKIANDSK